MLEQVRQDVDSRIAPLVGGIADDLKTLFRQEVALARSEMRKQAEAAASAGISLGTGAVCGLLALFLVSFGLVFMLTELQPALPVWGWFFVVGGVLGAAGMLLFVRARHRLKEVTGIPEKTIKTLKETVNA